MEGKVVDEALRHENATEKRILNFAALLARASGSEVIVVGGSAIEIYTRGGYVSGDLDVTGERQPIHRVLRDWGFKIEGRLWIHKEWKLAIDVVGPRYNGSYYRTSLIETPYGPVRVAAIEDLLIKRLAEAKHWQVSKALDEAAILWKTMEDRLDRSYLEEQAKRYDVADILLDFRRRMNR